MSKSFLRPDGRGALEIRPLKITRKFLKHPAGSVLVESGNTKIICTVMVENKVPHFRKNIGGWLSAEYGMLPGSVSERKIRDASRGKVDGRSSEIQRLLGRVLRTVVDLDLLGEHTLWIDADVIQADGGTRTAAINGAIIALHDALRKLKKENLIKKNPLKELVAAVSVGVVNGRVLLDLCYEEDSRAEVDLNLVMTAGGKIIEIQGTAEKKPFSFGRLNELVTAAAGGIKKIISYQQKILSV